MLLRVRFTAAVLFAAAPFMASCGGSSGGGANSVANSTTGGKATNAPAGATSSDAPAQTRQANAPPQAEAQPASGATGGANSALPVQDAAAFRDQLLDAARSAGFDARVTTAQNADALRRAWAQKFPGLKFAVFYTEAANPDTVSAGDTFLMSGVRGVLDQVLAFAVADARGRCAGGVAVIPAAGGDVSKATAPTVFKPVEMAGAEDCSGSAASDRYKP